MPYYQKSKDWLQQSALLLEARPNTTRITTKYTLSRDRRRAKDDANETVSSLSLAKNNRTRGGLTLKTYDPVAGVCLKYRTSKTAEVGRLVAMLGGTLGRRMAGAESSEKEREGLGEKLSQDTVSGRVDSAGTPLSGQGQAAGAGQAGSAAPGGVGGGGGGKGRKKKGKR